MDKLLHKLSQIKKEISKEKQEIQRMYSGKPAQLHAGKNKNIKKVNIKKKEVKIKKRQKMEKKVKQRKPVGDMSKEKKVSSVKGEHDLLNSVLGDLEKELAMLRASHKKLETKLDRFSSDLNSTQNKEIDLRNEISELMKKEAYLNQKKTSTKDKIATLIKKIEKITSVERQLQE